MSSDFHSFQIYIPQTFFLITGNFETAHYGQSNMYAIQYIEKEHCQIGVCDIFSMYFYAAIHVFTGEYRISRQDN